VFVVNKSHVAMLKVLGLIRPPAGVGQEQDVIMQLLGTPTVMDLAGFSRALAKFNKPILGELLGVGEIFEKLKG